MSPRPPRVKPGLGKAIPLVNPGEKGKVRMTAPLAGAKKMCHGAGK
jgi:hypothetical protein